MKNSKLVLYSLVHSVAVLIYTSLVAWILFNGNSLFGKANSFWMPVAMLLLFVLSATVVGLLVLGRPVYYYFNGMKSEALKVLFYTVAWLFLITVVVLADLAWFR